MFIELPKDRWGNITFINLNLIRNFVVKHEGEKIVEISIHYISQDSFSTIRDEAGINAFMEGIKNVRQEDAGNA
jgi:hypothetical protein